MPVEDNDDESDISFSDDDDIEGRHRKKKVGARELNKVLVIRRSVKRFLISSWTKRLRN